MEEQIHVCPPWVGKLMVNPVRKLYQNPKTILKGCIKSGDKVLEIGPGMGFFTIYMAQKTGKKGKVYCVDIQTEMLQNLEKRAQKYGVLHQVETITSKPQSFNISHLNQQINFALLFAVVHEVPDAKKLFEELFAVLKPGASVLYTEPSGHVSNEAWQKSLQKSAKAGFMLLEPVKIRGCIAIKMIKPN